MKESDVSHTEFYEFVEMSLREVPEEFRSGIDNLVFAVEDIHEEDPYLLGLYEGIPLTERGNEYAGILPDRIVIFRIPIVLMCNTIFEVMDEVKITVFHEIAHYFGISDEQLHDYGWG